MNKRLCLVVLWLCAQLFALCQASFEAGQCTSGVLTAAAAPNGTFRLVPETNGNKSLFVENASLDAKAAIVIWTETDVPAQQWTVVALPSPQEGDAWQAGDVLLQNVYSRLYLTVADGRIVQSAEGTPWQIETVDDEGALYNIRYRAQEADGEQQFLRITNTADGQKPSLGAAQAWHFVATEAKTAFDEAARRRMIDGYLRQYLQDKGNGYRTFINGGWGEAETLESILDIYEATGDRQLLNIFESCYSYLKYHVGDRWDGGTIVSGYDWWGFNYNDDVMWLIICAARAYLLTGKAVYLDDAKRNFDLIWQRAYLGYVGLLRWAEQDGDRNGTNSCINGPAEVAACYIAQGSGDETYYEKARELYQNQRQYLYEPGTGKVLDSIVLNPDDGSITDRNTWASTYNQGTMLGAAVLLYRHYGEAQYKSDADKIVAYARSALCNGHGIVRVCQNADGDFQGFKGILMRYAGLYVKEFGSREYQQWLVANAFHAYNNMNSKSFGHSAWLTKAAENLRFGDVNYGAASSAFGGSTALSAACAITPEVCIGTEDILEAENSQRSGSARVETDPNNGEQYVGGMDNGAQLRFTYESDEAGERLLKVYYLSGQSRNLQVTIGSKRQTVTCPNIGTWDNTADEGVVFLHVALSKGRNIIALNNPNGSAPNIDKIGICPFLESHHEQAVIAADEARSDGDYTTFDYTALSDGNYLVTVAYRADVQADMFLSVNDGDKQLTTYGATNGHANQRMHFVTLHRGENTLTFGCDTGTMPTIEQISIRFLDSFSNNLEAEYAIASGQTTIGSDNRASGGRYVNNIGNGTDNKLTFCFEMPEAGEYALHVVYFTQQNKQMYHSVNDGEKAVVSYGRVSGWTDKEVGIVSLSSGTNTITLGNDNGQAPYVDKIVLVRQGVATGIDPRGTRYDSRGTRYDSRGTRYEVRGTRIAAEEAWHTLSGLRIDKPTAPGVYIYQGKKIRIK